LAIVAGIFGGLFSRATLHLIKKFIAHTKTKVIVIALLLGVVVAIFNYFSAGQIAGSGHAEVLQIINNKALGLDFVAMKYFLFGVVGCCG
jgi:H+/Cl- antiporter ClcA